MRTKQYWFDLLERAGRTFAQALTAALLLPPAVSAAGLDVRSVDWPAALSLAAGAALLSALFSLGGAKRGDPESASLLTGTKQQGV